MAILSAGCGYICPSISLSSFKFVPTLSTAQCNTDRNSQLRLWKLPFKLVVTELAKRWPGPMGGNGLLARNASGPEWARQIINLTTARVFIMVTVVSGFSVSLAQPAAGKVNSNRDRRLS
eukprot:504399-Rhodomonas_salina.2